MTEPVRLAVGFAALAALMALGLFRALTVASARAGGVRCYTGWSGLAVR